MRRLLDDARCNFLSSLEKHRQKTSSRARHSSTLGRVPHASRVPLSGRTDGEQIERVHRARASGVRERDVRLSHLVLVRTLKVDVDARGELERRRSQTRGFYE